MVDRIVKLLALISPSLVARILHATHTFFSQYTMTIILARILYRYENKTVS